MENELSNTNYIDGELLDWLDDEFAFESLKSSVQQKTKESNEIIGKIKANLIAEDNDEVKYVVNLSDEQKEAIKNGTLKLDSKDGELYAQFKENGKYGKKLSIKEEAQKQGFTQAEAMFAVQLAAIKDQLENIVETLGEIQGYVIDTIEGLHNDRVALLYSGIHTFIEASQMVDSPLKDLLIAQSIKSLNDSQAQLMQEFKYNLNYLISKEYKKEKGKRKQSIDAKMDDIHRCFDVISKATILKAMIYININQIPSMLVAFEEYGKFINKLIKPNAEFLVECDYRENKLINTIWEQRASSFENCMNTKNLLANSKTYYITTEE